MRKERCPHCKAPADAGAGTHGGCYKCGRVKHNFDGRRNKLKQEKKLAA